MEFAFVLFVWALVSNDDVMSAIAERIRGRKEPKFEVKIGTKDGQKLSDKDLDIIRNPKIDASRHPL